LENCRLVYGKSARSPDTGDTRGVERESGRNVWPIHIENIKTSWFAAKETSSSAHRGKGSLSGEAVNNAGQPEARKTR
jgi:hypothetical protein